MKRRRILVMTHELLVPPQSLEGLSEEDIDLFRTENHVYTTLQNLGHDVRVIGIWDRLSELRETVREFKPHVVFNLLEDFSGIAAYDHHVVAYLEMIRQRYTGCNPRGLMLSRDKVLTKQVLAWHRVATPAFQLFPHGKRFKEPKKLKFPLFVKSATEDASFGISQASIVADMTSLRERVTFIHERIQSDALVEEYIDGRELYIGVLGNTRLTGVADMGIEFRHHGRFAVRHRHATHETESQIPGKARHHDRTGAGPLRCRDRPLDQARKTHLSRPAPERLCAAGFSHARRRHRVPAGGKRESRTDRGRGPC